MNLNLSGRRLCLSSVLLNFIIYCGVVSALKSTERTLSAQLNPGCPPTICKDGEENDVQQTVIHIKADAQSDTIHYIWELSRQPSVLVALTEPNTTLTIKWDQFLNDTPNVLVFSNKPKYTMSFILSKIFMFNDVEDRGTFSGVNSSEINTFRTQNLTWKRENFNKSAHEVEVSVTGDNMYLFGNGSIKLKLKCFGSEDHDDDAPHLLHSANVTQIDIEFEDLEKDKRFGSPRIAAEFILVADEMGKQPFRLTESKTLDDEHTPGIFRLTDITSPESFDGLRGSYVQFRPITYTHPDRDATSGREVHVASPANLVEPSKELNSSLAWSYFGNSLDKLLVQAVNISFGQSQDGFFTNTNYTTWTLVVGYGVSPLEHISMFVIIVACIGMGIPLLLLVAGGFYLFVKRARNR